MDKLHSKSGNTLGFWTSETQRFHDLRGFFAEICREGGYAQISHSRSKYNTLRGLHFRKKKPEHTLVTVMRGIVLDIVVDMRPMSPYFGKWHSNELCDYSVNQIYVAPGMAHGFYVYSDWVDMLYQTSELYSAGDQHGISWDDADLNIRWPTKAPILSERDKTNPSWREVCEWLLPERVGT